MGHDTFEMERGKVELGSGHGRQKVVVSLPYPEPYDCLAMTFNDPRTPVIGTDSIIFLTTEHMTAISLAREAT